MPTVPAQKGAGAGKNSRVETVSLNLPQRRYQSYTRHISSQAQRSSQQKILVRCNPQGQNGSWTFSTGDSESSATVGNAGVIFQLKGWQFMLLVRLQLQLSADEACMQVSPQRTCPSRTHRRAVPQCHGSLEKEGDRADGSCVTGKHKEERKKTVHN